jgi:hypothetical protein
MTVPRNEAFWLVPNGSELRSDAEALYEPRYRAMLEGVLAGDYEGAIARAADVRALYARDRDAYLDVLVGDLHRALGRPHEARSSYARAWASDSVNHVIRATARARGATLIDAGAAARGVSADSILGFDLFYDELHPIPAVHRAMAAVLADSIMIALAGRLTGGRNLFAREAPAPPLPDSAGAEVYAYEALRALYRDDCARTEAMADSALRLDPRLGKAHVYSGICATRRGDIAAARASWDALARTYPELLPAR